MLLSNFNYILPDELIARYPLAERSASRLLCLTADLVHQHFSDLPGLLTDKDLLVFNNTRVIPARLLGTKDTGGKIEVLVECILGKSRAIAMIRASKAPKPGSFISFANGIRLEVLNRQEQFFELRATQDESILDVLEAIGQIPLPPYMARQSEEADKERYQTVYAQHKGSVAAPTAGLHFDDALLQQLKQKGVEFGFLTLHVGAGTFLPVRVDNITEHRMHPEYIEVSPQLCEQIKRTKERGGRVVAVGTTSARSLETASKSGVPEAYYGDTEIFIYPGFEFKCVDALVTNFHLPESTLLMLVTAFGGYDRLMNAYKAAVELKYRFFSYGDAMWIERKTHSDMGTHTGRGQNEI